MFVMMVTLSHEMHMVYLKYSLKSHVSLFIVHLIPPSSMQGSYLEYIQKAQVT